MCGCVPSQHRATFAAAPCCCLTLSAQLGADLVHIVSVGGSGVAWRTRPPLSEFLYSQMNADGYFDYTTIAHEVSVHSMPFVLSHSTYAAWAPHIAVGLVPNYMTAKYSSIANIQAWTICALVGCVRAPAGWLGQGGRACDGADGAAHTTCATCTPNTPSVPRYHYDLISFYGGHWVARLLTCQPHCSPLQTPPHYLATDMVAVCWEVA